MIYNTIIQLIYFTQLTLLKFGKFSTHDKGQLTNIEALLNLVRNALWIVKCSFLDYFRN